MTNHILKDQVAIVTGAGRGIGESIARHFVEAGANVAVVSRSEGNTSKVAAAKEAIRPASAKGLPCQDCHKRDSPHHDHPPEPMVDQMLLVG